MKKIIKLEYTNLPAPTIWGQENLLSFSHDSVRIHITPHHPHPLRTLQQAGRQLGLLSLPSVAFAGEHWLPQRQWAFNRGFSDFHKQRTCEFIEDSHQHLQLRANAICKVKQLINGAPNQITPQQLAEAIIVWLSQVGNKHINVELLTGEELVDAGWQGLYQVGRGSRQAPIMLHIDYNPTGNPHAPTKTALVGKGITFDSGGYSLKNAEAMSQMKLDMAGAATMAGALALAISHGLQSRVRLVVCIAENMIGGHALRPGDVIHYKNNQSVEVLNTDAEGRLVLADGLLKAGEYEPELIIDAATLTGAALTALGTDYAAIFSHNPQLSHDLIARGKAHDELFWQLPLEPWHSVNFPSTLDASTANSLAKPGGGFGAASAAAGFLSRFVAHHERWIHVDMANAYQLTPNQLWAGGATGNSVLTLASLLCGKSV